MDSGRLGNPESTNAAEIDRVRSQSDKDCTEAEAVVGNNAATGDSDATNSREAEAVIGNNSAARDDSLGIYPLNFVVSSTKGSFVTIGRLGDPGLAGAAELDGVRSQSDANFSDAEVVVGNNAATGDNIWGKKRF